MSSKKAESKIKQAEYLTDVDQWDILRVLENEESAQLFTKFAQRSLCTESIEFWTDVGDYIAIPAGNLSQQWSKAREIHSNFLGNDAPLEVCLICKIRGFRYYPRQFLAIILFIAPHFLGLSSFISPDVLI